MSRQDQAKIAPAPLTRGKARTKKSQGKGWDKILNLAKKFVKNRPNDHLSSLLVELRELSISRKDPGRYYRIREMVEPIGAQILAKYDKTIDENFYYPDVRKGAYNLGHISQIRYLAGLIRPDTSGIIELGSGWSSNLFQLYIAHGATRSKKIIYYGGEYTREGQICSKYIAKHDEHLNYRSFSFDYRNPDVTFLKRQKGHILLFTSHSIEQVDVINPVLFEQLKEIANEITVVHLEPVGWQNNKRLLKKRNMDDREFFEGLGKKAVKGNIQSVDNNSAWWSWRLEYNKNLVPILDSLQKSKTIEMKRVELNFEGKANVLNPSSLFHYEFVRPGIKSL